MTRVSAAPRTSCGWTWNGSERVAGVTRRVRLIGCGNPEAGDDAVGLLVCDRLAETLPSGVEAMKAGPATRVLDLLDDVDTVVVVDAVRSAGGRRAPGTVVRAEADDDGLPATLRDSLSSHGLGL